MSRLAMLLGAVLLVAAGVAIKDRFGSTDTANTGGSKSEAALLMKHYDAECTFEAGSQFKLAEVDGMALCSSIARAYNFARTADRPERTEEFGGCWDKYSFHCVKK